MRHADSSTRGRIGRAMQKPGGMLLMAGALSVLAALAVRRKTRQAEREHPPTGQFIDVDGVRLHYLERGQGQPLVLLHGNGNMAEDFNISGLLDIAAAKYRVIAFDRPGYGYSERPRGKPWTPQAQANLLHHALQLLGVERPIVAGHSWGTLVAISLALKYPASVRSLVLLSGYYFPTWRLDALALSVPAIPLLGDLMRYTISPLLTRLMWPMLVRQLFGPSATPARFARFPVWLALRPRQLRASAGESGLLIPATIALRNRYRELDMPVSILTGDADRIVDAQQQSIRLHGEIVQSDLRLAPGVGHMLHYLAPQRIMAAIDAAASASTGVPELNATPAEIPSSEALDLHYPGGRM